MKIVTWNCHGALRNKFYNLLSLLADIYIIQECEDPTQSHNQEYKAWAKHHLWIGSTKNKGLGIFSTEHIKIAPLD